MLKYPMEFTSKSSAQAGINQNWSCQTPEFEGQLAVPKEFMGPGGAASPEDLFCLALSNCFLATFKVYAENSKLNYDPVEVDSKLIVDLDDNKKPVMKSLKGLVKITGASDTAKALFLAKKAASAGFILNSVKTDCTFEFDIS